MRLSPLLRTSLTLAALGALSAADAGAQKRTFQDSWFWGVKGGGMLYSTRRVENAAAPSVGAEWLITRTRAALAISASQYFFTNESSIPDADNPAVGRIVDIENMRNVGASVLAFPRTFGFLRPYAGAGLTFNLISNAVPRGGFSDTTQQRLVREQLQESRTGVIPLLTAGAMTHVRGVNVFVQGGFSPAKTNFLFNRNNTYFLEGGIRYNVGSAIERPN